MPKKACCCKPVPTSFCCNPTFYKDFITLYGASMNEHAEVSPDDWIALYVPRPGAPRSRTRRWFVPNAGGGSCQCCCNCPGRTETTNNGNPMTAGPNEGSGLADNTFRSSSVKTTETFSLKNNLINTIKNSFFGSRSDGAQQIKLTKNLPTTDADPNQPGLNLPLDQPANRVWNDDRPPCNSSAAQWLSGNRDLSHPEHQRCRKSCCTGDFYSVWSEASQPIIFAYKYSGCNLIWYPREYSFDHDPYINQCNGFLGMTRMIDENGNQTNNFENVQNSCQNWSYQKPYAGAAFDTGVYQCYQDGRLQLDRSTNPVFPCACTPFPHIHGGPRDSVFNRVNVRITSYQLGYVSYMPPFSPPMLSIDEAGCCWCASCGVRGLDWELMRKGRSAQFRSSYPLFDQQGKVPTQTTTVGVGINCHFHPGQPQAGFTIARNPNYKRSCYEWGISPYLLRIAKTDHKMAYSIWRYGRNASYRQDFGPVYKGVEVSINRQQKDITVRFKKVSGLSCSLKEQYVGFIQLEHHFECYAYRSDDASQTIEMSSMMNNCNYQVIPFERGYPGKFVNRSSGKTYWEPWKYTSIQWQVKRGVPRRVMYQGSGIPLFHFDLITMENLSRDNNIQGPDGNFDGIKFLEHYYRYFFAMRYFTDGGCEEDYQPPGPPEWNFSHLLGSYDYVNQWLQLMIVHGVLRIKDHAIDISSDVNKIIQAGRYIINNEGKEELVIADKIALLTGGLSGYIDLINFFDVRAGTQNATTPKIIKQKLLNTEGLGDYDASSGVKEQMRCFLPRKATLPLGSTKGGLTAWGCSQSIASFTNNEEIICPPYTNDAKMVPPPLMDTNPDSPYSILNPIKVVCGLGGTFVIDNSGKITVFGGIPAGGDAGCTDNPNIAIQYPSQIACIPWYLSLAGLFDLSTNPPTPQSPEKIPDGTVIDIAFKGDDCAVALCDFGYGALSGLVYDLNAPEANQAYEDDVDDYSKEYAKTNCNGENSSYGIRAAALLYQPFEIVQSNAGSAYGPRAAKEKRPSNAYRLKAWGSRAKFATFSLAKEDACSLYGETYQCSFYPGLGHDAVINPNNLRYPGTNAWFIWTKVAAGLKHYVALDDFGGVFATPLSDNEHGQCEKGFPISYEESANYGYKGFGISGHPSDDNLGFFYFNHIPRPGYIKEEEWTKDFYASVTKPDFTEITYRKYICACRYGVSTTQCHPTLPGGGPGGGGGTDPNSCGNQAVLVGDNCVVPQPPVYDQTCNLLGTLVAYSTTPTPEDGITAYLATNDLGVSQPRYTDVAAGHFNTLLLTNENKLEIYGKYWQIDQNGNINGPQIPVGSGPDGETTTVLQGITAFIPSEVEALKGTWNVTYACTIHCDGVTHSPIINASYNAPATGNVITAIDSSSDYSMCVANNNRVYVWGDATMVPTKYDPETYVPGMTASVQFNLGNFDPSLVTIDKIAAGVNAFYVYYRLKIPGTELSSSRLYSYTRYGVENFGTEVPTNIQNNQIIDISAGYAHAVAIVSAGLNAKNWDYKSFAPDTQKYQYKNWESIPAYFKRDAFFHAIPGGWDFSKWLYGDICCSKIIDADHPAIQQDTCSALAYNIYKSDPDTGKPEFNGNLSYSGNPHYFWMRADWRRVTKQAFSPNFGAQGEGGEATICDQVDMGMQIDNLNADNSPGGLFSTCGLSYLSVWGDSRPMISKIQTLREPIFPPCFVPGPCFGHDAEPIYTKGVIPEDSGNALSYNVDIPPTVSYRMSKDIFQKRLDRYGLSNWGHGEAAPCPEHKIRTVSYFKYCERHYYLGYDRDLDTWEIYTNPDFLHESTTNGLAYKIDENGQGITYIIPNSENGFGGASGSPGLCGYFSLYNYPMTGPSYPVEKYQYIPINFPVNLSILTNILYAKCQEEDPENSCYACLNNDSLNVESAVNRFAGSASFVWVPACRGRARNEGDDIYRMFAPYFYKSFYREFLAGKELLKGTDNHIGLTLPPEIDPTYTRYSFIDALKNPTYTEIEKPWLFPGSKKWIPLCWEAQNQVDLCGITTTDSAICFAGVEEDLEANEIKYNCITGVCGNIDIVFYSNPVFCNLLKCCAPAGD